MYCKITSTFTYLLTTFLAEETTATFIKLILGVLRSGVFDNWDGDDDGCKGVVLPTLKGVTSDNIGGAFWATIRLDLDTGTGVPVCKQ